MCGRLTQSMTWREIHRLYCLSRGARAVNVRARYNAAPTQDLAACRLDGHGEREVALLRWGLVPSWAKGLKMGARLINARAETVHEKPSFRAAFRKRRCVVPADGWFEWRRTDSGKQPYFLAAADGAPLSFAGLWERWTGAGEVVESLTIVTTAASAALRAIHDRQPAVLSAEGVAAWLDPATDAKRLLDIARIPLEGPYEIRPVSTAVNNVHNDKAEILGPVFRE